jgi:spermidine/putrescine transport system ATP-binding protein
VLLLDEALTNLDRRLRQDLQLELKRLQRELGITSLFVTHDQEEALTLSDRVIVMEEGRIAQVDEPSAIYDRPASVFVAGFIGESNRLAGRVSGRSDDGSCEVTTSEGQAIIGRGDAAVGTACAVVVRPRNVTLTRDRVAGLNSLPGEVLVWGYKGDSYEYIVDLDGGPRVRAMVPRREATSDAGDRIFVTFDRTDAYVLPTEG